MLGEGDTRAWEWYADNCMAFDQEYGLTALEFGEMGLVGAQRSLFKKKLRAIHSFVRRVQSAEMAKEHKRG